MKFSKHTHTPKHPYPGKRYDLDADGKLTKKIVGEFHQIRIQQLNLDLSGLTAFLKEAGPDTNLTCGISLHMDAMAFPQAELKHKSADGLSAGRDGRPFIGRTNEDLKFSAGPALMLIDTDGEQAVPAWQQLTDAVPALADYARVEASSSSSWIIEKKSKLPMTKLKGSHTFFHVLDGRDIPRTLQTLQKRLWLAGHGRIELTADGKLLMRSAVDQQLRVPSQPIFIRPQLSEALEQNKHVEYFPGEEVLDTRKLLPDLTEAEEEAFACLVAEAELALLPERQMRQREYVARRTAELVAKGVDMPRAQQTIVRMMTSETLGPDAQIVVDGNVITVADILADRQSWHGKNCRDPAEPSYGSDTVAIIYSDQPKPVVYSHAHGGRRYFLEEAPFADFDVDEALEQLDASQREAAQAAVGDAALSRWLAAKVADESCLISLPGGGELTAIDLGLRNLKHHLRIDSSPLPEIQFAPSTAYPGIGMRCIGADGQYRHIKVSIGSMEALLKAWHTAKRADALRNWSAVVAEHLDFIDLNDPVVSVVLKCVSTMMKIKPNDASTSFTNAVNAHKSQLSELRERAKPATPRMPDLDPAEISAQEKAKAEEDERIAKEEADRRAALKAAEDSSLLEKCRAIAENPMEMLAITMHQLGVAGEKRAAAFCYCVITSAHLKKPSNGITRGPSGTGKSHVMKAVASLFPNHMVYVLSSMSSKTIIYEPEGFSHRTIIIDEAEILARKDGEKNDVAEMLRILLSEGQLIHKVVDRDPVTQQHQTVTKTVDGPTNLLTTTTRAYLDPEVENRLVDQYSDTTSAHQKEVFDMLGQLAAHGKSVAADITAWHAFAEWIRRGPREVVFPSAITLSEHIRHDMPYRAFNNLVAIVQASALIHRLHREIDEKGRLIATLEDYKNAHSILGERLDELSEAAIPPDKVECFQKLREVIQIHGKCEAFGNDTSRPTLTTTSRNIARLIDKPRSSTQRLLSYFTRLGLLEPDPCHDKTGRSSRTTLIISEDADAILQGGKRLITPEELAAIETIE